MNHHQILWSFVCKFQVKRYFKESIRGSKIESSIDQNDLNYFLKSSSSHTLGDEKTKFPEYGIDLLNGKLLLITTITMGTKIKDYL